MAQNIKFEYIIYATLNKIRDENVQLYLSFTKDIIVLSVSVCCIFMAF